MQKDYYKILGIDKNATTEDIKRAYRRLVHKYHPDIAGNTQESINKFKEITEAYETLSSPQKREQYDNISRLYEFAKNGTGEPQREQKREKKANQTTDKQQEHQKEQQPKPKAKQQKNDEPPPPPKQRRENSFSKMRNEAKVTHITSIFSNFINKIINRNSNKQSQKKYVPPKIDGKDITTEVTLSITEAINGTERIVNILHMETCEKCKGRKFINGTICPSCNGVGEKSKYKKITVKIPPQVKHNSKIRVEGEGNKGFNGGKRGDLYLIVKIENNAEIKYDGLNVLRTIPVEPYEAVLGGYINFEMNGSNIQMKLMPNTFNGQKYRISEQGAEKDGKKGDLIVTIKIDIPKNITKEERELYEKLKLLSKRNIRDPQ